MKPIILILSLLLCCYQPGMAGIIKVTASQPSFSIQQALNEAQPSDTVLIGPGQYKVADLQVNKPVSIIGEGLPVLDGQHTYQILSIHADNVKVSGLKLQHTGISSLRDIAAIKIYQGKEIVISDNIIEGAFFGIYLSKASRCLIENNQIIGQQQTDQRSGNGIHAWKSDQIRIIQNRISHHRDGIYFEFVTHSLIYKNLSQNNLRYGLHFMFSNNDLYIDNVFGQNNAGVSVMFSKYVTMIKNTFRDNWGDGCYGLFLKEITHCKIYGNKITGNTTGIAVEGANRMSIELNSFSENGWALKVDASCLMSRVNSNNFTRNSFDIVTNSSAVAGNFDHNYWDKYEGYDLNKDRTGDIAYHPVSLFSMIVANNPTTMVLFRSLMATLLDKIEKIIPEFTPVSLVDNHPLMQALPI
ncbi:nitrous oxide reductase family maturation protein NosD [Arachidicoccus rhizosphaerae]|uniref:nitrous oxide reductase family maturation protein NosD n=1 Tax=Arachidicoccus rhizosphaerae TaxID=551991 RepID=UPI0011136A52|nr:nitrous oxide reductase family maturation protein NosD [Arachidicoccus rhizosphaerae]